MVDNIFVFVLVFAYFSIPAKLQHRVLFYGILCAAVQSDFRRHRLGPDAVLTRSCCCSARSSVPACMPWAPDKKVDPRRTSWCAPCGV